MTRPPDFDDLVGAEVEPAERDRLRRVHALLLEAGPPPELAPEIERGPTLATTLSRRGGGRMRRRVLLLAATVLVLAVAFLGGYLAGNGGGGGVASGRVLKLAGTPAAPGALASLRIQSPDSSGNWPMKLSAVGLPKLPPRGYYTVWLVRDGKPFGPCGTFVVADAKHAVSVWLNAPYRQQRGDTWVVTKQLPGTGEVGPAVLRPST
jgi:hypothetical protein